MTAEAPTDKRKAIVEALMDLASRRAWHEIEITDVAKAANVSLAEFRDLFPSKGAVLGALSRQIDRQVLEGTSDDLAGEPARERIFDVLMRRFDALAPYKPALRRITQDLRYDPVSLAALNKVSLNSQRFMLAAAGIDTEGPLGALKLQGAVRGAVIVGMNEQGVSLARHIRDSAYSGIDLKGFFDDRSEERRESQDDYQLVGKIDDLRNIPAHEVDDRLRSLRGDYD